MALSSDGSNYGAALAKLHSGWSPSQNTVPVIDPHRSRSVYAVENSLGNISNTYVRDVRFSARKESAVDEIMGAC